MKRTFCYATWFGVLLAVVAQAQAPAPAPKVIRITEANVKVGKDAAHEKLEANWTKTTANAKAPGQTLAMTQHVIYPFDPSGVCRRRAANSPRWAKETAVADRATG